MGDYEEGPGMEWAAGDSGLVRLFLVFFVLFLFFSVFTLVFCERVGDFPVSVE